MEASLIVNDFEQRLKNFYTTRIHDNQTLNDLESLINDCSNELNRLISSSDPTFVANILSSLLRTIISLSKICAEKSDIIISGSYLSRDKHTSLITNVKTLYSQIREFMKLSKLATLLNKSGQQRHVCEQIRLIADSLGNMDALTTLISHKLIVKTLTGGDDQQQSQQVSYTKTEDVNDGLIPAVYGSLLQQMSGISVKNFRDTKEGQFLKMYGIYLQIVCKLIEYPGTLSQIESYNEFIRIMIQIHVCLESTHQQPRFQIEFFNNTILLQEILQNFLIYSFTNSSKLFFDELFLELPSHQNKYASLIFLFRIIEAFDISLTKQSNSMSIHLINLLISHLFDLIDQCRIQLVLPALLPISFNKSPVDYGSLYDITYSLLMKLFNHESMQTVLSCMNKLLQAYDENFLTSIQLSSELIIQSWYLYNQSIQFQSLFGLFLSELLRLDIHSSLINYLSTMPNNRLVKFRAYDALISSNTFNHIYDFLTDNSSKELGINSTNLSLIYPTNLNHLYSFIRLFNTELNLNQIQHTLDTCIYSIQQFLSLSIITELTCQNFLLTLRVLNNLVINNTNENFKCLLGQLTQIFVILDEQTAIDIRLELLHLFSIHSNLLDDNDLGRLLDFILTNSIELNSNSIAFHIKSLDLIDSLRQRQSRSANITDLIIQLIVRYGNEHQCSHLLKAHLMRIFMGYVSNSNDDSLAIRVKSQCILLRASIDEFEKNKKLIGATTDRFPDENIYKIFESIPLIHRKKDYENDDNQLKFYKTILTELEFYQSSSNPNAMQQD